MVFAEDIRKAILEFADKHGPEQSFRAVEVARSVDPENWRNLLDQVEFVAEVLVKEGKIITLPEQTSDQGGGTSHLLLRKRN